LKREAARSVRMTVLPTMPVTVASLEGTEVTVAEATPLPEAVAEADFEEGLADRIKVATGETILDEVGVEVMAPLEVDSTGLAMTTTEVEATLSTAGVSTTKVA
jgi:hypothetical protein